MSYAKLQSRQAYGLGTSPSLAFSSNVTAGSLLLAAVYVESGSTDTASLSGWTKAFFAYDAFGNIGATLFYKENAAAGAVTVAPSINTGGTGCDMNIMEISGVAASSSFHAAGGQSNSPAAIGTDTATSGAVAATVGDLVVSFIAALDGPTGVASTGTGFTAGTIDNTGWINGSEFGTAASTSAQGLWTIATNTTYVMVFAATFHSASGTGAVLAGGATDTAAASGALVNPGVRFTLNDIDTNAPENAVTYSTVLAFDPANRGVIAQVFTNKITSSAGVLTLFGPGITRMGYTYDFVGWTADGSNRFHASGPIIDLSA